MEQSKCQCWYWNSYLRFTSLCFKLYFTNTYPLGRAWPLRKIATIQKLQTTLRMLDNFFSWLCNCCIQSSNTDVYLIVRISNFLLPSWKRSITFSSSCFRITDWVITWQLESIARAFHDPGFSQAGSSLELTDIAMVLDTVSMSGEASKLRNLELSPIRAWVVLSPRITILLLMPFYWDNFCLVMSHLIGVPRWK